MTQERFWVRVCKDSFVFSAAHFITYAGNVCERLHGHNYHVAVHVHGPLDENQYVVDFVALRTAIQEIVAKLDHHVLLPTLHPTITVTQNDREVTAAFEDRRWIFPAVDCVLLPVANTTAELLAKFIGQLLIDFLKRQPISPSGVRVEVDENYGQWGCWETSL